MMGKAPEDAKLKEEPPKSPIKEDYIPQSSSPSKKEDVKAEPPKEDSPKKEEPPK